MSETQSDPKSGHAVQWNTVFATEVEYLGYGAAAADPKLDPNLTGLCLSGGGVRSAIFCAGVLEYLGEEDLLKKFDYLSTVSGGGFTGAALSYWGHQDPETETWRLLNPAKQDKNPIGSANAAAEGRKVDDDKPAPVDPCTCYPKYVRHLRANISYLMPGGFRDAMVGAYVVLRSILINVLIYIGLTTGLFHLLSKFEFDGSASDASAESTGDLRSLPDLSLEWLGALPGSLWARIKELFSGLKAFSFELGVHDLFGASVLVGLIFLIGLALLVPVFSFGTFVKSSTGYLWRKYIESAAGACLLLTLLFLPIGLLPHATREIDDTYTSLFTLLHGPPEQFEFGVIGAIIGSAISLFGLFRARFGGLFGTFSSITVVFGAVLLILSVAIMAMHFADDLSTKWVVYIFLGSLALAVICNVNDASLGRFYRDRLMEAFMPNKEAIRKSGKDGYPLAISGKSTALEADRLLLTDLRKSSNASDKADTPDTRKTPPIHLLNTNVLSWWAPDSRAERRRGDNFILSSLFCGSDMTHWKATENVAKGGLTLATAMSVSGAAVNPQGGFAGQGPSTSWPVAIAMAFLSLRLGYWLRWTKRPTFSRFGNHIHPGLTQLIKRLFSSEVSKRIPKSKLGKPEQCSPDFIELSDGGHFDNLGLYEMIRRGCRVMVVCDGGHDPKNSYDAFSVLIRRVREDFGAKINFDVKFNEKWTRRDGLVARNGSREQTGPEDLVARPVKDEYPSGAEYAEKGYFLASVTYEGTTLRSGQDGYRAYRKPKRFNGQPRKGLIIYLKSTLIREVDLTTKGYRGSNPLFPSDPTANQFFSPEQFEAYRDLGKKIAAQMDRELVLRNLLDELNKAKDNDLSSIVASFEKLDQFD